MAHVYDVAAYILRKRGPMTAMKLQKLCYYSYGYHLAWEGKSLFPEPFEAWANGPVCPALYRMHRGQFNLDCSDIKGEPDALNSGEQESVDLVLEAYGELSAHQLSVATHREEPWLAARQRAHAAPLEWCDEPLLDAEIAEFFEAVVASEQEEEAE